MPKTGQLLRNIVFGLFAAIFFVSGMAAATTEGLPYYSRSFDGTFADSAWGRYPARLTPGEPLECKKVYYSSIDMTTFDCRLEGATFEVTFPTGRQRYEFTRLYAKEYKTLDAKEYSMDYLVWGKNLETFPDGTQMEHHVNMVFWKAAPLMRGSFRLGEIATGSFVAPLEQR